VNQELIDLILANPRRSILVPVLRCDAIPRYSIAMLVWS